AAASNGRSSTTTTTTQQLQQRQHRPQEASSRWHPQPQQKPRRGSNETPHFVPGPAPAKHNKAPAAESWFVNASGRFVAPATKGSAAAAVAAAASSGGAAGPAAAGAAGGSGSPIITALRVQATPEKILPVPMVVASSSGSGSGSGGGTAPEINAKCPECQDLVKARLDEPTLMSEDRHRWEDGAFGAGGSASETLESGGRGEQAAAGSTARRAASAWRLRELTRTFNVGIILCLNFGAYYCSYH
ncbi:unnamed protein product, partial [Ectocarpus sp. 4 AP-2014]